MSKTISSNHLRTRRRPPSNAGIERSPPSNRLLLQEYRTRLVADVVTGKLDVREAAALLPDESENEDPTDEGNPLVEDTYEDSHDPDVTAEELAMESEVTV